MNDGEFLPRDGNSKSQIVIMLEVSEYSNRWRMPLTALSADSTEPNKEIGDRSVKII